LRPVNDVCSLDCDEPKGKSERDPRPDSIDLLTDWDPIGVAEIPEAVDEYDA